jgi:hypothetical protein
LVEARGEATLHLLFILTSISRFAIVASLVGAR